MVRLSHEYVRSIALIADIHVGSRFAVCPNKYIGKGGNDIAGMMNEGQKQLLEYWNDYVKNMRDYLKVDTVFIVGDAVAGINPKESGLFMMTSDLDEQIEMVLKLLEPLCKNKKVATWSGTMYHQSRDVRIHKFIAEAFNGKFFGSIANIKLTPSNKVVNVAHRTTSAVVYPETVLSRDILFAKEAQALGKLYKIHTIIRAHRHSFCEIHKHDLHYISLPAWQTFIPYERAIRWYFRYQPDIGGAVLLLDKDGRIRVWHYLYKCPHISDKLQEI